MTRDREVSKFLHFWIEFQSGNRWAAVGRISHSDQPARSANSISRP